LAKPIAYTPNLENVRLKNNMDVCFTNVESINACSKRYTLYQSSPAMAIGLVQARWKNLRQRVGKNGGKTLR
jgi:hypothetical protein